ncbi:DNA polymerase III subunit delta [Saliniramus sp.]|uniref:DNA polymerase III subunit delta n=1 Tax=Saliniramus sp. TaxID=2986772 RepID=UPI002C471D10|nr:DNA polymerase III subunit delta [Saliniramus sp.]HMB12227.1 DNA polymerase III subunit delta [Saliniramus sp.]
MATVKASDAERTLANLSAQVSVVLLYGPDSGLVSERGRHLADKTASDAQDPFQMVRLDGDVIAGDPGRLADEVGTITMFGDRRVIRIRIGSKNLAPAVEAALAAEAGDTLVIVEAGDLAKSAPLRSLCEKARNALAVPCYQDDARELGQVIDGSFREAGISVSRETRQWLVDSLGGDRLSTRAEIEKILLYAYGQDRLEIEDIQAVSSNVADLKTDMLVDAAFCGRMSEADSTFRRLRAEGAVAHVLLGALNRHAVALLPHAESVAHGNQPGRAVENWRGLFFKRKAAAKVQLEIWGPKRLLSAIERLQGAVLETRRNAELTDVLTSRAILDIARAARSKRR